MREVNHVNFTWGVVSSMKMGKEDNRGKPADKPPVGRSEDKPDISPIKKLEALVARIFAREAAKDPPPPKFPSAEYWQEPPTQRERESAERLTQTYQELKRKMEVATPTHPETGEVGTFVRFVGPKGQPLYRTPSGKEFFISARDEEDGEVPEGLSGKYADAASQSQWPELARPRDGL